MRKVGFVDRSVTTRFPAMKNPPVPMKSDSLAAGSADFRETPSSCKCFPKRRCTFLGAPTGYGASCEFFRHYRRASTQGLRRPLPGAARARVETRESAKGVAYVGERARLGKQRFRHATHRLPGVICRGQNPQPRSFPFSLRFRVSLFIDEPADGPPSCHSIASDSSPATPTL